MSRAAAKLPALTLEEQREAAMLARTTALNPAAIERLFPRRRRPDPRTTLQPRVVVREDGCAYITFTRPRPQRSTPA